MNTLSRGRFRRACITTWLLCLALPLTARAQYRFRVTELTNFFPTSINQAGHATGVGADNKAYEYKDGVLVALGTLGGAYSRGYSINNHEEIVGVSDLSPSGQNPFYYKDGTMVSLTSGETSGWAQDINDQGQIVGRSEIAAFLYQNGSMQLISTTTVQPYAINNLGDVTGWSMASGSIRGFLYSGGVFKEFSAPGGAPTFAEDINDNGDIVGAYYNGDTYQPYLYSHGVWKELGPLPGGSGWAYGINNHGQVVGSADGGAFLYENGRSATLDSLVDLSTTGFKSLTSAAWITDNGYIAGVGRLPDGTQHGFILTPDTSGMPRWWVDRGVIDTSRFIPFDYAAANQGQAKHIARKAFDQLEARLPGGAGPTLTALVNSWSTTTAAKDFAVINVGQLKNLAKPFYDRLAAAGYQGAPLASGQTYPWTDTTSDDADYAIANVGQVKRLFSFDP